MAILKTVDKIKRDMEMCNSKYDIRGFFEQCADCEYDHDRDSSGSCRLVRAYKELTSGNVDKAMEIMNDN